MTETRSARFVAVVTLYLAAAIIAITGTMTSGQFLQSTSWIPLAILLLITAYERWAWAWNPKGIPRLRGTWLVLLKSTWVDPETGTTVSPRGVLVVRQTAYSLEIVLMTSKSISVTLAARLRKRGQDNYELSWIYENVPSALLRDDSPIHYGAVVIERLWNTRVNELIGSYFTSRDTKGEFQATKRRARKYVSTWNEAVALFPELA